MFQHCFGLFNSFNNNDFMVLGTFLILQFAIPVQTQTNSKLRKVSAP
jgi:hypothetical protein